MLKNYFVTNVHILEPDWFLSGLQENINTTKVSTKEQWLNVVQVMLALKPPRSVLQFRYNPVKRSQRAGQTQSKHMDGSICLDSFRTSWQPRPERLHQPDSSALAEKQLIAVGLACFLYPSKQACPPHHLQHHTPQHGSPPPLWQTTFKRNTTFTWLDLASCAKLAC